jgi:hypothetical protein
MICGHGSRDEDACAEFARVVHRIEHVLSDCRWRWVISVRG